LVQREISLPARRACRENCTKEQQKVLFILENLSAAVMMIATFMTNVKCDVRIHHNNSISASCAILEKRASPQQNGIAPIGQISELKSSPPAKKIVARRPGSIASPQEKSPLKGKSKSLFF
jgi:hypothetical protein